MATATAAMKRSLSAQSGLGALRDSSGLLRDTLQAGSLHHNALRARMAEDGYLFLRGVQRRDNVQAARDAVIAYMDRCNYLDRGFPSNDAVLAADHRGGVYMGGRTQITHQPDVLALLESAEIMAFFNRFLDTAPLPIGYKWLRAAGAGATDPHYDVVYMGRGTPNLYTCWMALGDISLREGPLAVLRGSHNLESYRRVRETYGKADVDRDNISSFFSHDPFEIVEGYGGEWQSSDFKMGDVIIFTMLTMHASLENQSSKARISCDTRFQPANEPLDERWIGREPAGNYAWKKTPVIPTNESRKQWGV